MCIRDSLPEDFEEKVRSLPSATIVHIPTRYRENMCTITAATLNGMCEGNVHASMLEEARSKLLLSPIPKGHSKRVELGARLKAWFA
eukprot:6409010-Karenia_brevis.AAC.1